MRNSLFRVAAYGCIGLLAFGALQLEPPTSRSSADRVLPLQVAQPELHTLADTLDYGETLTELLRRSGMDGPNTMAAIEASALDARRLPANLPVTVTSMHPDSLPTEIVLRLSIDKIVRVTRSANGWVGTEELLPWSTDTVVVRGTVQSNLYSAMDSGAATILSPRARILLTESLASVYDYRVDMSRDLQLGDEFRVLFERQIGPDSVQRIGHILASTMVLSGRETRAFRYAVEGVDGNYFDQSGRPMKSGFLRSPLAFTRITSNFGMRRHPVLGSWRNHAGTDYGAASGTPVRAIGDGSVIFAGWRGGYGNVVDIRHRNGFVSRYAHLRGFGRGVRSGVPVSREDVIGYVGQTGLATGPHLHFEILVNGTQRNPRTILATVQQEAPIPESELQKFSLVQQTLATSLFAGNGVVRVAQQF